MKLKLDENLGKRLVSSFQGAGHDAVTAGDQRLSGSADRDLIHHCRNEERVLVTLDLDFANPFIFRPSQFRGIAVLRPIEPVSSRELEALCRTLIAGLSSDNINGKLWIIERARIRVHQEE